MYEDFILIRRNLQFAMILAVLSLSSIFVQTAEGKTYALIINGINKDPQNKLARTKTTIDLQTYLLNNTEVTFDTMKILIPDKAENNNANNSHFANVKKVITDFESVIKPEDKFIFYYTGQANVVNKQLRFNLPNDDVTQKEMGELIKNIKAASMLIVLDCPAAGLAVKELSAKGRIIICSCTDQQSFSIKFGESFISALNNTETDIDNDGKKSILEVFISTSKNVEDWYRKEKLLLNETPVLDDNGDGEPSKEPWRYIIDLKDGLASSKFFLETKE